MKLKDLKTKLEKSGVASHWYSLSGGLPNEAFCINHISQNNWEVYYSERGQKSALGIFEDEYYACLYFWNLIMSDTAVIKDLKPR